MFIKFKSKIIKTNLQVILPFDIAVDASHPDQVQGALQINKVLFIIKLKSKSLISMFRLFCLLTLLLTKSKELCISTRYYFSSTTKLKIIKINVKVLMPSDIAVDSTPADQVQGAMQINKVFIIIKFKIKIIKINV